MKQCPRCGYPNRQIPDWVYSLRYLTNYREPIFSGLLVDDRWKSDVEISTWMQKGWVELVPNEGFIITDEGRKVLAHYGF